MDPVSFPASVLMTHCNSPKTWRSAITTQQEHRDNHISISAQSSPSQTIYHYVFPFTPVYFSISTHISPYQRHHGSSDAANRLVPPSFQFPWCGPCLQGRTTSFLKWWLWRTLLQDLAIASGHSGGSFPLPIRLSHHIRESLITFPVAGSFSVPPHTALAGHF